MRANRQILSDVDPDFYLRYTDIYVGAPCRYDEWQRGARPGGSDVTPNECRLRDLTYAAPILVDLAYSRGRQRVVRKGVTIGRLPIMLRSAKCVLAGKSEADMARLNECPLDPGGYFIVNGAEKVVLVQEQLSKNRVIVEADPRRDIVQASVTSSTHERKSKSYVLRKKERLVLHHNILGEDVPVSIVFKAMGITCDLEILTCVAGEDAAYQDLFAPSLREAAELGIFTQQQALEFVGARIRIMRNRVGFGVPRRSGAQEALEALSSVIIPHVPVRELDFRPKAMYLAFMVRRVLMACSDPRMVDDRDYVGNKRLELAGQMLALLFEDLFKLMNNQIKQSIDKILKKPSRTGFDAVHSVLQHNAEIGRGMVRALSTGNWNLKRFHMNRAGVTHVLSRLSYISALGMMTRISSQFEKTRKVSGPRALQPSQFGMLCTSDTPEGEACGLVKNLALMTHITTDDEEEPVRRLVFVLGAQDVTAVNGSDMYREGVYLIFVNGTPIALTTLPKQFLNSFRSLRRMGRVSEFVSIYINHHHNAVHIATDEGRICRPLIVVERAHSRVTLRYLKALRKGTMNFNDFLARGLVEYLDVNEENDANIAMTEVDISETTTHLEIEPFTILGVVAGLIPYPHHNQSPRNTYQCAMGKQAIGAIARNQHLRIDTLLYLMVYPQRPLVATRALELVRYDQLPAGQNAVVAVMSYSGYDIEDALVLNRASCDRGFGRCQVFRKYATTLKKYADAGNSEDRIADTETFEDGTPLRDQRKLDAHGVVEVGERLESGDKVLLKQVPLAATEPSGLNNGTSDPYRTVGGYRPAPLTYRLPQPSYVDRVLLTTNDADARLIKVRTRQTRAPEVGDKFSSRHGQKGVVGLIAEPTDMPFSDEGIVPDVIMNPHGFPSRMTVGKMLELVSGKAGVIQGTTQYGNAFGGSPFDEMAAILSGNGFSYAGKDMLTSGVTGEPLPAYVFTGPIYYQKLKHMVADKMHARARGPRAMLTRQPMEGRSRDGGLRLGEMERDCLIAYGASRLLLERLMLSSDAHLVDVCEACGRFGWRGWCQGCGRGERVTRLTMPYAAKLLVQELLSMNVCARIRLEDEFPPGAR